MITLPSMPPPGGEPASQPRALLDRLLALAEQGVLGVTLGLLAGHWLRRRGRHWSWALVALALAVLFRRPLGGAAPVLILAALSAALVGRRHQRADLRAGGELAELARRRSSPADLLRPHAGRLARALLAAGGADRWLRSGELPLGRDEHGRTVSVPFAAGGGGHALVLGATGSGKTVTQAWIAGRAIERGLGAVIVDPKGDSTLREELLRSAAAGSRPFLAWSPRGALAYNPYARGSDTEIADKLLAGERFTEPHYQRQAQRYLGHAVRALQAAGAEVSLRAVVERLEPERLEALARALPEPDAAPLHGYLDSLGPRQRAELAGVRDRLAILAESEVGRWLDPGGERSPERHSAPGRSAGASLDLLAAVRERAVVYFSLEADRLPLLTEMLAGAIVQDLCSIVAALQERPVPTLVVIDEFSAVAPARVVRLFARARSAGFSLLLGTQELSDLRPPGGERLLEQVMGNISLLIAHRQVVPGSAELIARLGGGGSPRGSSCAAEAGAAEAGAGPPLRERSIMELAPGWGAVIVLGAGRRAQIARMFAPGPAPAAGGDGARAR